MAQAAAGAVGYAVADRPALKHGAKFDRLKPVENLIQTDGWPPEGGRPSSEGWAGCFQRPATCAVDRPALKHGAKFDRLKPVENLIQTDGWPPSGIWPSCGRLGRMLSVSGDLGESESPPV
jgi:hypothetical protein